MPVACEPRHPPQGMASGKYALGRVGVSLAGLLPPLHWERRCHLPGRGVHLRLRSPHRTAAAVRSQESALQPHSAHHRPAPGRWFTSAVTCAAWVAAWSSSGVADTTHSPSGVKCRRSRGACGCVRSLVPGGFAGATACAEARMDWRNSSSPGQDDAQTWWQNGAASMANANWSSKDWIVAPSRSTRHSVLKFGTRASTRALCACRVVSSSGRAR